MLVFNCTILDGSSHCVKIVFLGRHHAMISMHSNLKLVGATASILHSFLVVFFLFVYSFLFVRSWNTHTSLQPVFLRKR